MEHSTRRNFLLRSATAALAAGESGIAQRPSARRRNVIFILSDDHRYDAFGFMPPVVRKNSGQAAVVRPAT
jgi:hypothetical protein